MRSFLHVLTAALVAVALALPASGQEWWAVPTELVGMQPHGIGAQYYGQMTNWLKCPAPGYIVNITTFHATSFNLGANIDKMIITCSDGTVMTADGSEESDIGSAYSFGSATGFHDLYYWGAMPGPDTSHQTFLAALDKQDGPAALANLPAGSWTPPGSNGYVTVCPGPNDRLAAISINYGAVIQAMWLACRTLTPQQIADASGTASGPGPGAGSQGTVQGDPHFVGFDGAAFDFSGAPGVVFNVISLPETQVNALLGPDLINGLTYITALGVSTTAGVRVKLAVSANGGVDVEWNDEPLAIAIGDALQLGGDKSVAVERVDGKTVSLSAPGLSIVAESHKDQFLDLKSVGLHAAAGPVHGVLGQTAIPDRGMQGIVGDESDYYVASLWSADSASFKYSVYNAGAVHEVERAIHKVAGGLVQGEVAQDYKRATAAVTFD